MECKLCLGRCDHEIHNATERLHEWWKRRLDLVTTPVVLPKSQPWTPRRRDPIREIHLPGSNPP
jgi:hypothetical protein